MSLKKHVEMLKALGVASVEDQQTHHHMLGTIKLMKAKDEFEKAFEAMLPTLAREGITYTLHMVDAKWPFLGFYVQFENRLKTRSIRMDFKDATHYRYCYTEYYEMPKYRFGQYDLNCFLIFIYDNLLMQ
jgi:hypothetical protein